MKRLFGAAFLALALVLSTGIVLANAPVTAGGADSKIANEYAFRAAMRELWEDHIVWTRQVIVSVIAGTPDANAAVGRLLENQAEIGNAIKPFYGDAAGDALTVLLREHIVVAGDLLSAAKSGDATAFEATRAKWYRNGDDIARFLAAANPEWPLAAMQAAMKTHLDTTLDEAVARLKGDWAADVVAYDRVHAHILHMADALSDGIIVQFPAAFAGPR